jgi:hypothetical protein
MPSAFTTCVLCRVPCVDRYKQLIYTKKQYLSEYIICSGTRLIVCNSLQKINSMCKDQLIISPTKCTPEVILDPKGIVKLTGRLIPENAEDFFVPIEEWIKEYFCNPAEITYIEIILEYINSVGTRYLLDLIRKITHFHLRKDNKKFIINWYCKDEDEDILEKGTFFSSNLGVPFNFITIV